MNKPSLTKISRKPKKANCILCGKIHERREGTAHDTKPLCQKCDDAINKSSHTTLDTMDFKIRGF